MRYNAIPKRKLSEELDGIRGIETREVNAVGGIFLVPFLLDGPAALNIAPISFVDIVIDWW
jgi:hypothetical protein